MRLRTCVYVLRSSPAIPLRRQSPTSARLRHTPISAIILPRPAAALSRGPERPLPLPDSLFLSPPPSRYASRVWIDV